MNKVVAVILSLLLCPPVFSLDSDHTRAFAYIKHNFPKSSIKFYHSPNESETVCTLIIPGQYGIYATSALGRDDNQALDNAIEKIICWLFWEAGG